MLSTNTNIMAINVNRTLTKTSGQYDRQLEALGSGLRIKKARSDAAGLSISEGFRSQLTRLGQNVKNAEQASDLLKVAEGSLAAGTDILQRMRVLAMRGSNGHLTDQQRKVLSAEYVELVAGLDRTAQATVYNDRILLAGFTEVDEAGSTSVTEKLTTGVAEVRLSGADLGTYTFIDDGSGQALTLGNGTVTQTIDPGTLLDGTRVGSGTKVVANFDRIGIEVVLAGDGAARTNGAGSYEAGDLEGHTLVVADAGAGVFQVGPTISEADQIEFELPDLRASGDLLNLDRVSLSSQRSSRDALNRIDQALEAVTGERGKVGALLNRLEKSISFSENEIENTTASESTIRDTDMARSATDLARTQILQSTSTQMLQQAFTQSRQMLTLL